MSYDSKYSGAVAEQMLDDYVGGKLGGEGGAKVYSFDLYAAIKAGAVTQDVYDAIIAADVVIVEEDGFIFAKYIDDGTIRLDATRSSIRVEGDLEGLVLDAMKLIIEEDLTFNWRTVNTLIPTKTSELTNDSDYITSAALPISAREEKWRELSQGQVVDLSVGDSIAYVTPVAIDQVVIRVPSVSPVMDGYPKECRVTLAIGTSVPSFVYEGNILWADNALPKIMPNYIYEFTFKFNFSVYKWLGVCVSYNMG